MRALLSLLVAAAMGSGGFRAADDPKEIKFEDCPAAVKKTFQAEAKGAKITKVGKEGDEGEVVYWADVHINNRAYSIGVAEDGTLSEMNLAVDADEVPFSKCPSTVQTTLKKEAWDEKIETVAKDIKYGTTVFETTVTHKGRVYEIVVDADGTVVEKTLVIDEQDMEFDECPEAVKKALKEHAKGGKVGSVTKTSGLGRPSYQADVEIDKKGYLVEVNEDGHLISKSRLWDQDE
jgi:hypothetical protein